jgi:hypothetical protein
LPLSESRSQRRRHGRGANKRISAKTRSGERAEHFAQEYRDAFDPETQELKQFRAENERPQVPIQQAVSLYCADMTSRLGKYGAVAMARSMFGDIAVATDVKVYFCDPQSPWERGSNESTNGLLRQYLSKKADVAG